MEEYIEIQWKSTANEGSKRFYPNHPDTPENLEKWKQKYKNSGVSFKVVKVIIQKEILEEYNPEKK